MAENVVGLTRKRTSEPTIKSGLVVCLKSDVNEQFPMTTTGEVKNGKVYCRWYTAEGSLEGDWFNPDELELRSLEEGVDFQPDFDMDAK